MVETDEQLFRSRLQEIFTTARRHESALAIALQVADPIVGLVAAARLRQTLLRATAAADDLAARQPSWQGVLAAEFREVTRGMYELLQRAPTSAGDRDLQKFTRWVLAYGRSTSALDGPHLYELDAAGTDLAGARLLGIHAVRCRFITAMPHARFEDAYIDLSDFTYSNLWRSAWLRTRVHRSHFREASLSGAVLDRTTFIDCDLRGADLSVDEVALPATAGRVQFIRCDLRGSNWTGRDLSRVKLLDCKLYGVAGVDLTARLQIARADVSAAGDGSRVIHAAAPCAARGGGSDPAAGSHAHDGGAAR
jgi:uncharacterized protein YjbI with pentapeptide repeats